MRECGFVARDRQNAGSSGTAIICYNDFTNGLETFAPQSLVESPAQEDDVPLLDHFHRPWKTLRPWQGFHSTWATALAQCLNHGWLPPHHFAIPNVSLGNRLEIDVATLDEERAATGNEGAASAQGRTATALWAPPKPTLSG